MLVIKKIYGFQLHIRFLSMFNAQNAVTVTSSLSRTEKDIVYYNSGTIEKF